MGSGRDGGPGGAGGGAAADYMHICIVMLSLPESQELLGCSVCPVPPAMRPRLPEGLEGGDKALLGADELWRTWASEPETGSGFGLLRPKPGPSSGAAAPWRFLDAGRWLCVYFNGQGLAPKPLQSLTPVMGPEGTGVSEDD